MSRPQTLVRNNHEPKIAYMQQNLKPTIRVQLQCNDPLITEQHHAKSCDINTILARAIKNNGMINHVNQMKGDYSGLANSMDYHDAVNAVMNAESSFALLPAEIRSNFQNDPSQFLDFVDNPDNFQEMRDMGLITPSILADNPSLDPLGSVEPSTPADPVPAENTPPAPAKAAPGGT